MLFQRLAGGRPWPSNTRTGEQLAPPRSQLEQQPLQGHPLAATRPNLTRYVWKHLHQALGLQAPCRPCRAASALLVSCAGCWVSPWAPSHDPCIVGLIPVC